MEFYRDQGNGVTQETLQSWRKTRHMLDDAFFACGGHVYKWNIVVVGVKAIFLGSGCTSGYGGEGPNGTVAILKDLRIKEERAKEVVFNHPFWLAFRGSPAGTWHLRGFDHGTEAIMVVA